MNLEAGETINSWINDDLDKLSNISWKFVCDKVILYTFQSWKKTVASESSIQNCKVMYHTFSNRKEVFW